MEGGKATVEGEKFRLYDSHVSDKGIFYCNHSVLISQVFGMPAVVFIAFFK